MVLVLLGVCLVCLAGVKLEAASEKHVVFPTTIPTDQSSPAGFLPISVRVSRGAIGPTKTVRIRRGGHATPAATNSTKGFVGFRKTTRTLTAAATASATHAAKPKKPKRPVKRMSSIGAPGEHTCVIRPGRRRRE